MAKPVIGITGVSGFIGAALTAHFLKQGYAVIPFGRNIPAIYATTGRRYDLREDVAVDLFRPVDILIHCAAITPEEDEDAARINVEGTKRLISAARQQGVRKIVFFSSVSAHEQAISEYGKSKLSIHGLLDPATDVIIKCSLVVGAGGLFGRLLAYTSTRRLVPLIGDGRQVVQLIGLADVVNFVERVVAENLSGTFVLANDEQFVSKEFFRKIAEVNNRKLTFVPVPVFLLKMLVSMSDRFGMDIPITKENIAGFQSLKYMPPSAEVKAAGRLEDLLKDLKNKK